MMRAAVLTQFGEPLRMEELQVSGARGHEVLVRTAATGICRSDRLAQLGQNPRAASTPLVLGHESAGVVEAVGPDVTLVQPGDPVVTCAATSCGTCEWCQCGEQQHCTTPRRSRSSADPPRLSLGGAAVAAFVGVGGFATHLLVDERVVVPIPPEMPLDRAAVLGCAVHTGIGAVRHTAQVRMGDAVVALSRSSRSTSALPRSSALVPSAPLTPLMAAGPTRSAASSR